MKRFARRPWIGVLLLLGLLACEPGEPPARLYLEDFERGCDGMPCGWERSAGEPAQALWVETIHPGEHGLRLEGAVAVRGPAAPPEAATTFSSSISVRMAARCDAGATLAVELVVTDAFGARHSGRANVRTEAEWSGVSTGMVDLDDFASDGRVSTIVIRKGGTGVCDIGELVIDDIFVDTVGC